MLPFFPQAASQGIAGDRTCRTWRSCCQMQALWRKMVGHKVRCLKFKPNCSKHIFWQPRFRVNLSVHSLARFVYICNLFELPSGGMDGFSWLTFAQPTLAQLACNTPKTRPSLPSLFSIQCCISGHQLKIWFGIISRNKSLQHLELSQISQEVPIRLLVNPFMACELFCSSQPLSCSLTSASGASWGPVVGFFAVWSLWHAASTLGFRV